MEGSATTIQKNLYTYNLVDGAGYKLEFLLVEHGIVVIGVTKKEKEIYDYFNKLKKATHIISYRPKKSYKKEGKIFKDIYKLNKPQLITNCDDYKNSLIIQKSKLDVNFSKYEDGKYKWYDDPDNYHILWTAELIKEIIIPYDNSGINNRKRFGFVSHNNKSKIYTKF